jgi:hypothetical protein
MSSYVHTDQYVIQQNNVGVHCYMTIGDIEGALYFFRRALTAKLALERRILAANTTNTTTTTGTTTTETTGGEDKRLQNLDSLALEVPVIAEEESQQRCVTPEQTDFRSSDQDQLEVYASGVKGMSHPSLSF